MKLIGVGMSAKIYEYTSQAVAKVFNPEFSLEAIEYEKNLLIAISELDIKAPKYLDFVLIDNKPSIIMQLIPGNVLFEEVLKKPFAISRFINLLIEAQAEINAQRTDKLPDEKSRFLAQLDRSGLDDAAISRVKILIENLPKSESVCHGDFHFGNLIYSSGEIFTIDWMNSYSGNPVGDIVRSYLMLKSPFNPLPIKGLKRFVFMRFKSLVAEIYLSRSLRNWKIKKNELRLWLVVVASVRLCDNVPGEREWLLEIIDKYLQLTKARIGAPKAPRKARLL